MRVYILQNKEQIISSFNDEELRDYCNQNSLQQILIETSFAENDLNWLRQYHDEFILCAKSIDEAKDFVLRGYYHAKEFDGERGVIFNRVERIA